MAYQLLFRSPAGERLAALESAIVVGRDDACDVVIDSVRVSRRHAEFIPSADGVTVRDLGSRNGIVVNGTRVEQASIGPADRVLLGDVSVTVQAMSAGAAHHAEPVPLPTPPAWTPPPAQVQPFPDPPPALVPPPAPGMNPFGAPGPPSPFGPAPSVAPSAYSPPAPASPVAFQAQWPAAGAPATPDKTTMLPAGAAPGAPPGALGKARASASAPAGSRRSLVERLGLGGRITILVALAAMASALVGALPLLSARNTVLDSASRLRVTTIARALALEVGPAMAAGQTTALGIGSAMAEPGVREALVLSPEGRVLAPPERLDETLGELPAFGPITSLQGAQTVQLGHEAQAVIVIDAAGRRVGIVWVRLDPSYQAGGSGAGLYVLAALFTALVLGMGAAHVVRKLVWGRLAGIATDIDLASSGQLASVTDPFGVPRLADSINFVVNRARSGPAPLSAAALAQPGPPSFAPPAMAQREGTLVLNPAYVIQDARGAAAALVESSPERLAGHHVIEVIPDQGLVGAILDCVSELSSGDTASRQVDGTPTRPPLDLEASRMSDGLIHVALRARG